MPRGPPPRSKPPGYSPGGTPASTDATLPVLDMGLDFRSYQSFVDEAGNHVLGNVVRFSCDKVADTFEPTVGLLVTLLHFYIQSSTSEGARVWLSTYDVVQKIFIEQGDARPSAEARKCAEDARRAISVSLSNGGPFPDENLYEKLLIYLDHQSGIRGVQAPSQRRVPRDPKGTFCNLHLSDHRCNQEFSCNQLHLHQAGSVKHRTDFHVKMIETLFRAGMTQDVVLHRVQDSLMFARYGNRVTVRYSTIWIKYFQTLYTKGRLEHALRRATAACPTKGCQDTNCRGIHVQDERNLQPTKQTDLPNPEEVASELETESLQLLALFETKNVEQSSPTSEQWRNTVRDYVRQAGIQEMRADEALLRSLEPAGRVGTPMNASGSDTFTPLLHELEMKRFESNLSMDDSR